MNNSSPDPSSPCSEVSTVLPAHGADLPSTKSFLPDAQALPSLGRYRIQETLGSGGFGTVFKAYDDELQREVAIKVPHRVESEADAEAYLIEARILASLDHPGIVPVYDVGRLDDGRCYLVSKFVPGSDLAHKIKQARPSFAEAVEIVVCVAEALHHAH